MVNKRIHEFNKNKKLDKDMISPPDIQEIVLIKKDKNSKGTEVLRQDEIDALLSAISSEGTEPKKYILYPKGQKQTYKGTSKPNLLLHIQNKINDIEKSLCDIAMDFFENDSDYSNVEYKKIYENSYISLKYKKYLFLIKPIIITDHLVKDNSNVLFLIYPYNIIRNKDKIYMNIDNDYSVVKISDELSLFKFKKELLNIINRSK